MESQEYSYCCEQKKKCRKIGCLGIVAIIIGLLFFFSLGLLIGAAISGTILANLAAIIVLAIVLGVILVLTLILILCKNLRNRNC